MSTVKLLEEIIGDLKNIEDAKTINITISKLEEAKRLLKLDKSSELKTYRLNSVGPIFEIWEPTVPIPSLASPLLPSLSLSSSLSLSLSSSLSSSSLSESSSTNYHLDSVSGGKGAGAPSIYLKITYHYNWFASWIISPITTFLQADRVEREGRIVWVVDATIWMRKNKLKGYRVTVQPICETIGSRIWLPVAQVIL